MKHSKGEWECSIRYIHVDNSTKTIAELYGNGEEREANGKLISAAPDLLESCINFIKWADDLGYYNDFKDVRLAIKKATS